MQPNTMPSHLPEPQMPAPQQAAATNIPPVAASTQAAIPSPLAPGSAASEEEIVDESWVTRCDQLVRTYAHDPRRLSDEMSALRVAYQRTRFGKEPVQRSDT